VFSAGFGEKQRVENVVVAHRGALRVLKRCPRNELKEKSLRAFMRDIT